MKHEEMQGDAYLFFRSKPVLPKLLFGNQILEFVPSHKLLGSIIQDDLRWNEHVAMIVAKASRHLHILCVLQ